MAWVWNPKIELGALGLGFSTPEQAGAQGLGLGTPKTELGVLGLGSHTPKQSQEPQNCGLAPQNRTGSHRVGV